MKYLLISASYDAQGWHGLIQYSIGIYAPIELKKSKELPQMVSDFIDNKLREEYKKNGCGHAFMGSWIDSVEIINGPDDVVFDIAAQERPRKG